MQQYSCHPFGLGIDEVAEISDTTLFIASDIALSVDIETNVADKNVELRKLVFLDKLFSFC